LASRKPSCLVLGILEVLDQQDSGRIQTILKEALVEVLVALRRISRHSNNHSVVSEGFRRPLAPSLRQPLAPCRRRRGRHYQRRLGLHPMYSLDSAVHQLHQVLVALVGAAVSGVPLHRVVLVPVDLVVRLRLPNHRRGLVARHQHMLLVSGVPLRRGLEQRPLVVVPLAPLQHRRQPTRVGLVVHQLQALVLVVVLLLAQVALAAHQRLALARALPVRGALVVHQRLALALVLTVWEALAAHQRLALALVLPVLVALAVHQRLALALRVLLPARVALAATHPFHHPGPLHHLVLVAPRITVRRALVAALV
jgi:hypothetical protein